MGSVTARVLPCPKNSEAGFSRLGRVATSTLAGCRMYTVLSPARTEGCLSCSRGSAVIFSSTSPTVSDAPIEKG